MTSFRVVSKNTEGFTRAGFAVGKHTGSLYLVTRLPKAISQGRGIAVVAKNGIQAGKEYPLDIDEMLMPGTVIEITV